MLLSSDVLFRHFKNHQQKAKNRLNERSPRSTSTRAAIPTTPTSLANIDSVPELSTIVVADDARKSRGIGDGTYPSPEAMSLTAMLSEDFAPDMAIALGLCENETTSTNGVPDMQTPHQSLIEVQNTDEGQGVLSGSSLPFTLDPALRQSSPFHERLDTLDVALVDGTFEARPTLAAQDSTPQGNHFGLESNWWLSPIQWQDQVAPELADIWGGNLDHTPPQYPKEAQDRTTPNGTVVRSPLEAHSSRIQDCWAQGFHRKKQPRSNIWQDLATGEGLFNNLAEPQSIDTATRTQNSSRTLNHSTKQRVWSAFQDISDRVGNDAFTHPITAEILEIAYEQYIIHHHSSVPMIHLATFRPEMAPTLLLLVMCSIGLSIMGTGDLNCQVSSIFPVRISRLGITLSWEIYINTSAGVIENGLRRTPCIVC